MVSPLLMEDKAANNTKGWQMGLTVRDVYAVFVRPRTLVNRLLSRLFVIAFAFCSPLKMVLVVIIVAQRKRIGGSYGVCHVKKSAECRM